MPRLKQSVTLVVYHALHKINHIMVCSILICSIPKVVFAQHNKLDSLQQILSKDENDTNRVKTLCEIAQIYTRGNSKKSISYVDKALSLSRKIGWRRGEAMAFRVKGILFTKGGNYKDALNLYQQSTVIYREENNISAIILIHNNMMDLYDRQALYKKALKHGQRALTLAKQINDKEGLSNTYNHLGVIYKNQGIYDKAISFYTKSLKLDEELGDKVGISYAHNNIGRVYWHQKNYKKSLEHHMKALEIHKELNDTLLVGVAYNNIGLNYKEQKKIEEAKDAYLKALDIFETFDNKLYVANLLNNLGEIFLFKESFEQSLSYFNRSLKISKIIKDKRFENIGTLNLGIVYLRKKEAKKADSCLNRALRMAVNIGDKDLLRYVYKSIAKLYEEEGDYIKATTFYKLYLNKNDSVFAKEKTDAIAEMQTKYETEKKERENKLLKKGKALKESQIKAQEATIQRQNILTVGITLGALLLSFFALVFYRQRAHIRRLYGDIGHTTGNHLTLLMKMLESQKSKLQLHTEGALVLEELDATQQVLMNIASVYGDRKENDSRRGKHMINVIPHLKMLAETLRDTTQHQDYPVELIMDLPDEYKMTINQAIYLSMFTNEVIVNALKHAFEGHTSPQIRIQLTPNAKKHCQYIIQDNGVGFPVDFDENALDSEGFEQMKDFIKNLRAELVLDKKHQGVKYCLNF